MVDVFSYHKISFIPIHLIKSKSFFILKGTKLNQINKKINLRRFKTYRLRQQIQTPASLLTLLFLSLWMVSCNSSTGPEADPEPDPSDPVVESEGIQADLGEETVYIAESLVTESFLEDESDPDNHMYSFNAESLAAEGIVLTVGEILLIHGKALRRISEVSESNGVITVETEFASLNEAFENADISWDKPLEFTREILEEAVLEFMGKEVSPKLDSFSQHGDTISFEMSIESGDWEVQAKISAIGQRKIQLVLLPRYEIEQGNTSASGAFRFETEIGDLSNETNITIRNHETEAFTYRNKDLGGTVDFQFAGAGGTGPDFVYPDPSAPAALRLRIPTTVGPMPVVVSVGMRFVVRVRLGVDSSAHLRTSMRYSGSAGFEIDGLDVVPIDELEEPIFEPAIGNAAGNLGVTVDAQYGVGYPDISLELFGNTIVPYVRPEFYVGAALTWGPLCTMLSRRFEVNAGLNLRFLGKDITGWSHNFIRSEAKHYSPEGCGGSGKALHDPFSITALMNSLENRQYSVPYIR